jgi:hypothetical protein
MLNIKYYPKYLWSDGGDVFSKDGLYPVTPRTTRGFKQFFLEHENGTKTFVNIDTLKTLVEKSAPKSRGKTVLQKSTGKKFSSIKEAVESSGLTAAKLKTNDDFVIS